MQVFKPYPGNGLKWGLGLLALTIAIVLIPLLFSGETGAYFIIPYSLVMLLVVGSVGYFLYAAKNLVYLIDGDKLVIKWGFNQKVIPLSKIVQAEEFHGTWKALKVMGAGWPGFHLGNFQVSGVGNVNLYSTTLTGKFILLRTSFGPIGISPEDGAGFLKALEQAKGSLTVEQLKMAAEDKVTPSIWRDRLFQVLFVMNLAAVAGLLIWMLRTIPNLPDSVPLHWGLNGVDRYGSPQELYIMALISGFIFGVFSIIAHVYGRLEKVWAYFMMILPLFITLLMGSLFLMVLKAA